MFCKVEQYHSKCKHHTSKGCSFLSGSCEEVASGCTGCENRVLFNKKLYCRIHPSPKSIWVGGKCKHATN